MLKEVKPRDKIYRNISKVLYLKGVLGRLEDEYIQIMEMVNEHNLTHERGIGFWSLIRIIFPVIEAVASAVGKQKEDFLEKDLGVPFGHLVWELYRHSLMHTDELRYAVYRGKTISWGAHLGNEITDHIIAPHEGTHPTTVHIVIPKLYYSLRDFLKNEIEKNDESIISIQVGVHFPEHESKIISELEKLYSDY